MKESTSKTRNDAQRQTLASQCCTDIHRAGCRDCLFRNCVTNYRDFVPNEYAGYRLKAGAEGWYTEEGRAYVRINSDGLRDREHTRQKSPNTLRIAVLGDSFTEAKQVPLEDAYWTVMADSLQSCPALDGSDVEVINFGVSGYGTLQELLTLRHYVWNYNPDVILLAFFTGDDVQNNFRPLEQHALRPFASLQNGEPVFDAFFTFH